MAWVMRTDWVSESILADWNRRDEAGKKDRVLPQDKGMRGGLVNKGPGVSSADKELVAEDGTGVLRLRLALEGNKDKEKQKKKFGRLTSFKRGKDVGPAPYFSHISTSEQNHYVK